MHTFSIWIRPVCHDKLRDTLLALLGGLQSPERLSSASQQTHHICPLFPISCWRISSSRIIRRTQGLLPRQRLPRLGHGNLLQLPTESAQLPDIAERPSQVTTNDGCMQDLHCDTLNISYGLQHSCRRTLV